MAITRRQFVTRLGAIAAAAGFSQADVSKITQAFAYGDANWSGTLGKPRVVWVHGAECTGCSTSVLGLFEDATGTAIEGTTISTLKALDLAVGGDGDGSDVPRTFANAGLNVDPAATVVNIQDVLVDIIDLQYHETVMGMGGDMAAQWLKDFMANNGTEPFVLVVEGAVQKKTDGGAWGDTSNTHVPWCSIGMTDDGLTEHSFEDVVLSLAQKAAATIAVGQCATYGGYPACQSPLTAAEGGWSASDSNMTGAQGVYDFLVGETATAAAGRVINVPGCPVNPWWFVLTVVAWLVDFENGYASGGVDGPLGILDGSGLPKVSAIDSASSRRLNAVYSTPIHGPACPRFQDFLNGNFATAPGDDGCLQLIGCKGPHTKALCGVHGWNGMQPHNDASWDYGIQTVTGKRGSHCITAGHPCMGCSEKGYPDAFVPFVVL